MYENEKLDMRVKYTREWTFEALSKLLGLKNFNDIKISEIIEKAGISRATFYRNFSCKEDIVILKVHSFFNEFYIDIISYFTTNDPEDETFLVQSFFKRIDEEEKLIDTVIKSNLEYLMTEGILQLITTFKDAFYQLVQTSKVSEAYTMDIVASSAWTLLSRWHKTGKKESASRLAKIYISAFRNIYVALYEDKTLIGD